MYNSSFYYTDVSEVVNKEPCFEESWNISEGKNCSFLSSSKKLSFLVTSPTEYIPFLVTDTIRDNYEGKFLQQVNYFLDPVRNVC